MDVKSFLQADLDDPKPFPKSFPQLQRLDCSVICTVCKEIFKGPVSITCGHSFCSACIRSSLTFQKKCPTCGEQASEGSIRRNRALEEITDAWEEARPQLLEFTKPARKRGRDSGGASSSGATKRARHSPSKRQSPSKSGESSQSISASTSDHEVEVVADSSDVEEVQELSESDEAPCPMCGAKLEIKSIPGHIERGCPPPKAKVKAGPSSGSAQTTWKKLLSGAGAGKSEVSGMKRITKPNYSLISIGDLRGLLTEYNLPTTGDRPSLESRFQEWTILFNANLDTSHPKTLAALRAKLAKSEESRKRDRERGKDEEVEQLQSKEGLAKHAREQRSEFERLRQDIMERKARKERGDPDGRALDTAIEVE